MSGLEGYADALEVLHEKSCAENAELRRRIDLLSLWCAKVAVMDEHRRPAYWRDRAAKEAR